MAKTLIPIPNQPLRFMDYDEAKFCEKVEPYCYLHQPDDPIRIQFKQNPCADNELCNPTFQVSPEYVTNGDFDGSAAGWTIDGTGVWAYNSGKIKSSGAATGSYFEQTLATTAGKIYRVDFVVSSRTKGSLRVRLGSGATFINITSNGNKTLYLTDTSDHVLRFQTGGTPPDYFDGFVDDISVTIVECWIENTEPKSWLFNENGVCHTPGSSVGLINSETVFTTGVYYKVVWKITNRTAGTVVVLIGDNSDTVRASNGTFTEYFTGGVSNNYLEIVPSTDFDGCIEGIEVFVLKTDFIFSLLDEQGTIRADLTPFIVYDHQYVNLILDGLNDPGVLYDNGIGIGIVPVPYGCYTILVEDECAALYGYYCGDSSDYISNCIKYAESFSGTYLVTGNNNPDNSVKKYAFGFSFSAGFYLVQRLFIGFRKPKYPSKFDKGKYSSGFHYKNFVETDKVFEMIFGAVSEVEHDCIAVQINCKEFGFIRDGCLYQYFNITEEYAPDWDAKGVLQVVESRIEVMPIGDTLVSSLLPSPDDFL